MVCEPLAVVAVELVHALSLRGAFCGGCAQPPFAEYSGDIALGLHQAEYIIGVARDGILALGRKLLVAADGGVAGVQAGDEGRAGRGADRCAGVVAGENHSVCGESVDVGRPELLLAVAAQVSVAEVVGDDEDYVRLLRLLWGVRAGGQGQHSGAKDD